MKIAVIGASGWLGGAVAREALRRGHDLSAIARDGTRLNEAEGLEGAIKILADVTDEPRIGDVLRGHDVVVCAVTDRSTPDRSVIPTAVGVLLRVLPSVGRPRLVVVGGGGSLETAPGVRALDAPDFPSQYLSEARAQAEALEILRSEGSDLDWAYLSPPPHELTPGKATGSYRVQGGDSALTDESGRSAITSDDLASALVDEIEQPRFSGQRFTAAY